MALCLIFLPLTLRFVYSNYLTLESHPYGIVFHNNSEIILKFYRKLKFLSVGEYGRYSEEMNEVKKVIRRIWNTQTKQNFNEIK